ncbi:MAG: RsmE family RNA methyltransferase [Dehalococcoidia bacterium]
MQVPRLYVPGHIVPGSITLTDGQAKRLGSAKRMRAGDEFRVFAGDGREWRAVAGSATKQGMLAEVHEVTRQEPLPQRVVEVWLPLVRPNRFEWGIEKCVEAGADIIRPLITVPGGRTVGTSAAREERWERIAVEAMEQCGRLHPTVVEKPLRFGDVIGRHHGVLVVADGAGRAWADVEALLPARGVVAVAIGRVERGGVVARAQRRCPRHVAGAEHPARRDGRGGGHGALARPLT